MKALPSEFFLGGLDDIKLSGVILDVLDLFSIIFISDITTKKDGFNKRVLTIEVPVTNVGLWSSQIDLIRELIFFVSGDDLNVDFVHQEKKLETPKTLFPKEKRDFDCVTLLSGGLDSFCGAFFNYSNNIKSIYVSYQNNNNDITPQHELLSFLSGKFKLFDSYVYGRIDIRKEESSQRTRSLLYMALGVLTAKINNIKEVRLYENGIMSLNPSLYGRLTTKTTHPKTVYLFNKLLSNLEISIKVINPFIFKTKGEIVSSVDEDFRAEFIKTTSCSTSKQNKYVGKMECGFCVPCVLRKISLSAYDLEKYDRDYVLGYGIKLRDIENDYLCAEIKSSVEYFQKFMDTIDNEEIFSYLEMSKKYYEVSNYYNLTIDMLKRFSSEFERYISKNALY